VDIVGPTDSPELELPEDEPELELEAAGDDATLLPEGADPDDEETKGFESVLREAFVRSNVN
jgi:hypothetical protein